MAIKTRTKKESKGIHGGGGKTRLTELQKILMGKGAYVNINRTTKKNAVKTAE